MEEDYLNRQILLRVPGYFNTFKTKDPVNLELLYNSNDEIVFPRDFNVKIFEESSAGWIEIKEKPTERYPPEGIIFSKETSGIQVVALFPNLPDPGRKYFLRIYVFGDMKEDNEVKKVAAYGDVTLRP